MGVLDLLIVAGYLAGITALGAWFGRRQQTTKDYFIGHREVPWWAVSASIVATETSTITFISVPGIAYAAGGNFTFLQLVLGYLIGRVVISILFIPSYFKGELLTVYELLHRRFGGGVKMLAAGLFVIMRNIADGVRLLLTAIVLAAVARVFLPEVSVEAATVASILVILAAMIFFTYYGGMEAVIWVEVIQLGIYLFGALAAAVVLANNIPGGLADAIAVGAAYDKFTLFDFSLDLTKTYTFWAGVVGGTFLNMSTHGTDQYLVQRYLATRSPGRAARALLASGLVVLIQFAAFLFIGVLLFGYYQPYELPDYAQAGVPGSFVTAAAPFDKTDQVFPDFITKGLPTGISGLVVAAIFAAAMSSSLNAIAATFVNDLYRPFRAGRSDQHYFRVSHVLTLLWGLVQGAMALLFFAVGSDSALATALAVASLLNGPVLGVFLLGAFSRRTDQVAALAGMAAGCIVMVYVWQGTGIAWPWYAAIGSLTTLAVGWAVGMMRRGAAPTTTMENSGSERL